MIHEKMPFSKFNAGISIKNLNIIGAGFQKLRIFFQKEVGNPLKAVLQVNFPAAQLKQSEKGINQAFFFFRLLLQLKYQ